MRRMFKSFSIISSIVSAAAQVLQAPYHIPQFASISGKDWPSVSDWASLNSSVGGRLQALRPLAAVCYTSDPLYDEQACQLVLSAYNNETDREAVAAALLWPNWESCGYGQGCALNYSNPQPISGETCHQGSTPYSVTILNAQDASTVVQWATAHNIKMTVKNTGHDYLGRSAGPSTLQVFTHLMDDLTYVPKFVPQGSNASAVPALTMGAGAQIHSIYTYAASQNITPIIGACLTVGGTGGYIQGGGDGPLTPTYGLAVDNAVEFQIVTADGQIRTVNEVQNPDLFWAVRGGGAGSWGIIIEATIRVYPQVSIGVSTISVVPNPSQNMTTLGIKFIGLVSKYQNFWLSKGVTGVVIVAPSAYSLSLYWPDTTAHVSDLYSFFDELGSLSENYTVVSNTMSADMFPSISDAVLDAIGPLFEEINNYGASIHLASRLIPRSAIEPFDPASINAVAEAIWAGLEIFNEPFESPTEGVLSTEGSALLLGSLPAATAASVNMTAANPGMYAAGWHVVYSRQWTLGVSKETFSELRTAVSNAILPLDEMGFTSSYQNEGDPFEPDWQKVFYGYKYEMLSSIKEKYDPYNVFQSYKGVASVLELDAYECFANQEADLLQRKRHEY